VTSLPTDHPFRKHSENLRAVAAGLKQAERAHKQVLRKGDPDDLDKGDKAAVDFAARMHQLMIGLYAEAQLRKIVSDPGGFNTKEQDLLRQKRGQLNRWLRAVEFAFRRHYSVPLHLEIDESTTAVGVPNQHATIRSLLCDDLGPIIEDRNKLAHAQWRWLLNNKETRFNGVADEPLNYLAAARRSEVITYLAGLIHTLVVSEPTFRRDYDRLYEAITRTRAAIDGTDYVQFVKFLRSRRR
jgi:hypothetical protein